MTKFGVFLGLLLFNAVSRGGLVLPDATVTFWASFKDPNELVDYLTPFLTARGFLENERRNIRSDGLVSTSFHLRSTIRMMVTVHGHASGEQSHCTVVDFTFLADGYDLDAHMKGSTRNEKIMAEAFELASDFAAWLRIAGAADVKAWQAEENEHHAGSIDCLHAL